jgi:hypothetical protein
LLPLLQAAIDEIQNLLWIFYGSEISFEQTAYAPSSSAAHLGQKFDIETNGHKYLIIKITPQFTCTILPFGVAPHAERNSERPEGTNVNITTGDGRPPGS